MLSRQCSLIPDSQNLMLMGLSICSKNAVILDIVILPADSKRRVGESKVVMLFKESGAALCVLKSG